MPLRCQDAMYTRHYSIYFTCATTRTSPTPSSNLRILLQSLDVSHTPLPLRRIRHLAHAHPTLGIGHSLNILEANLGSERPALPSFGHDAVELIDLFQREALRFIDHEPNEGNADEAEAAPNLGSD